MHEVVDDGQLLKEGNAEDAVVQAVFVAQLDVVVLRHVAAPPDAADHQRDAGHQFVFARQRDVPQTSFV